MLNIDSLFHENHQLGSDARIFINGVLLKLLNTLGRKSINTNDVELLGRNDLYVFRGEKITLCVFSRSQRFPKPNYSEYELNSIKYQDTNWENILLQEFDETKPDRLVSDGWEEWIIENYGLFRPFTVCFSTLYFSLDINEMIEAQEKVAEVMFESALEDVERKNRIVRVNPVFNGREYYLESDLCFVLMEFKSPFLEIYKTIIEPTVISEGFKCLKSDEIYSTTSVIEDIWANINKATLVIAEISTNNPNVMYELGICHTIGKNVMMLTMNVDSIPFNFRHMRCYPYKNDIPSADELRTNIQSVIQNIKSIQGK